MVRIKYVDYIRKRQKETQNDDIMSSIMRAGY